MHEKSLPLSTALHRLMPQNRVRLLQTAISHMLQSTAHTPTSSLTLWRLIFWWTGGFVSGRL